MLGEIQADDAMMLGEEMLHAAILRQASDIHIDPDAEGLQIRFRVDGALERYRRLPMAVQSGIVSRFKVLSGMDIAEKRAPQDGGFKHRYGRTGQTIDIRVATLPTKHGERMTLRLLALQTEQLTLERLGMREGDLATFHRFIDQPHGMILLTGPTGSGKTTTLYAAIRRLMEREELNIVTVEDPIEYEIKGVAQMEVDSADKVSFVKALRSVLRHDPDVVMIGEIRDNETADVAIKASLTGHLVFSTLHTNSAVSVITRLADLGVDRFLIAATLRLAVAQRLVRQLCSRCRKQRELTAGEAVAFNHGEFAGRTVFEPGGCIYCAGRGYAGRIGLFEMLPLDEDWSRRISEGAEEANLILRMRKERGHADRRRRGQGAVWGDICARSARRSECVVAMPIFNYVGRDTAGRPQRGTQEAPSAAAVANALRQRGWLVLDVRTADSEPQSAGAMLRKLNPLYWLPPRSLDIELSLQQMAVMLRSGLTLLGTLKTLAEYATRHSMRNVWENVAEASSKVRAWRTR